MIIHKNQPNTSRVGPWRANRAKSYVYLIRRLTPPAFNQNAPLGGAIGNARRPRSCKRVLPALAVLPCSSHPSPNLITLAS